MDMPQVEDIVFASHDMVGSLFGCDSTIKSGTPGKIVNVHYYGGFYVYFQGGLFARCTQDDVIFLETQEPINDPTRYDRTLL